ncbi:MAG: cytochrome c [Nitrospira sp.]|nr:cytochrome c [Nitrospira sp.]
MAADTHNKGHLIESISKDEPAQARTDILNGEKIYHTGISMLSGKIAHRGGPEWIEPDDIVSCAACHGDTGKGEEDAPTGDVKPADIRYKNLMYKEHHHGGVADSHKRYTDELIKRAITGGLNPAGKPLDHNMPRFLMNDKDLEDLIKYLKTLK